MERIPCRDFSKRRLRQKSHKLTQYFLKKPFAFGILPICLVSSYYFTPVKVILDRNFWVAYLQTSQCCSIALFILAYILLTILGIPGTVLTLAGGIIFGLFWGTILSVIGATLGALGAFWTARYLLKNYTERKFQKNKALVRLSQAVTRKPFFFILTVRFAPISPFNVVNFLFGLTSVHWIPYTFATFFGIVPGTFAYTWLGVSGKAAWTGKNILPLFLASVLLVFLSLTPILVGKKLNKK